MSDRTLVLSSGQVADLRALIELALDRTGGDLLASAMRLQALLDTWEPTHEWLADRERAAAEKAWDEGHSCTHAVPCANPYRRTDQSDSSCESEGVRDIAGSDVAHKEADPTMPRSECRCPNDCDCDGRFACEASPVGTKGTWICELVVGHEGPHKHGGHRWETDQ